MYVKRTHVNNKKPIVVVGNCVAGGSGKSSLVYFIAHYLKSKGVNVAIVTRGYKGSLAGPVMVTDKHNFKQIGDEAVMLRETDAVIVVSKDRMKAVNMLQKDQSIDVIITDDGLQQVNLQTQHKIMINDLSVQCCHYCHLVSVESLLLGQEIGRTML